MAEPAVGSTSLIEDAAQLGVTLGADQAQALLEFGELLLRWNRAFNLISRRDTGRLVPRHLLDSLSLVPWLIGGRVLDVGTGAGLPGVPLAIAREDAQFTLIDMSERKIRFIGQVVRSLGLTNVTARCLDVRELPIHASFETVVCRAVSEPAAVWTLAGSRLAPKGRMVIMSRAAGRAAAGDAASPLPPDARLEGVHRVHVPGLDTPHELMLLRHAGTAEAEP